MPVTTAIAIFFLIWWVVLFAVLPFRRSQPARGGRRDGAGNRSWAPTIPRLGRKLLWTTLVSAVIFAGCYVVYVNHLVTLEGLVRSLGMR